MPDRYAVVVVGDGRALEATAELRRPGGACCCSTRRTGAARVARRSPLRLLDPAHGPLYAVRLSVLTRKTLDGLLTDTSGRVLRPDGSPLPGLWAAGEAAGFGGGVHGHRALEGTFLGGCLFPGRTTGRALAC